MVSTGSWRNRWSGWISQLCCSCFCASKCFYRHPCVRLTMFMMLGDSPSTLQFFLWKNTCTFKCRSKFVYVDFHQQFSLIRIPNLQIQIPSSVFVDFWICSTLIVLSPSYPTCKVAAYSSLTMIYLSLQNLWKQYLHPLCVNWCLGIALIRYNFFL